jgi:hypothetical protein
MTAQHFGSVVMTIAVTHKYNGSHWTSKNQTTKNRHKVTSGRDNRPTTNKGGDRMSFWSKKDNVNNNNKDEKGNNKKVSSGKLFSYKPPKQQDTNGTVNGKKIKGFKWL